MYKILLTRSTRNQASKICASHGMRLARVKTRDDLNKLKEQLILKRDTSTWSYDTFYKFWIELSDERTEKASFCVALVYRRRRICDAHQ